MSRPLSPVIYISGVEVDAAARRASNSIFLQKPIEAADLIAIFRKLDGVTRSSL